MVRLCGAQKPVALCPATASPMPLVTTLRAHTPRDLTSRTCRWSRWFAPAQPKDRVVRPRRCPATWGRLYGSHQHALTRRPWRLFPAAILVTTSLALPPGGPGRFGINRALVRLALRGTDETRYGALAVRIGTELAQSAFRNDSLIEEACRCREAGSRVIVLTATERRLARSYLDAVGLGGIELVASELTFPNNRPASLATYNIGPQKVCSLIGFDVDLASCLFYTDSATDLPLMKRVAKCVLVAPSSATERAVRLAKPPIPFTIRRSELLFSEEG
jgi:phosphatidylglycerophosphatase C